LIVSALQQFSSLITKHLFDLQFDKIMADTITTTTTTTATTTTTNVAGNINDDWEVAVDTGEFDKRLELQEKARATNQVNI
jgi:hypothetical protein